MNADQNRTGFASASSHDSQAVTSGSRAATQLDSSTLLPAPADPTTTAGPGVRAEFDDCTIAIGPGSTTLRAELPDQCAMSGLIQRIIDLRLEITSMLLLPHDDAGEDSKAAAGGQRREEQPRPAT
jgi:hypothetical protein